MNERLGYLFVLICTVPFTGKKPDSEEEEGCFNPDDSISEPRHLPTGKICCSSEDKKTARSQCVLSTGEFCSVDVQED